MKNAKVKPICLHAYVNAKRIRVLPDGRFAIGHKAEPKFMWQMPKGDRRRIRNALFQQGEIEMARVAIMPLRELRREDMEIMGYPDVHSERHHSVHYWMEDMLSQREITMNSVLDMATAT